MQARERVLRAMRRAGGTDRAPFEISWGAFTPSLMEEYRRRTGSELPPEEYFDFDTRSVNIGPTRKRVDFGHYYPGGLPENAIVDEWGVGAVPGGQEHFLEYKFHPLARCESAAEVLAFDWPDVDADYRFDGMEAQVREYHRRGYAVTGELYQTIFETAWLLRGMEDLLADFLVEPEIAHAICEKLTALRVRQAEMYAAAGVDILRLGDDVATQKGLLMSREVYAEYLKERTRRIVGAAKRVNPDILVFLHSDGAVEDLIEDYIDIGIDILNPVQPECNDLARIGRLYGDRLSFWGGIGTQTTMPFGTCGEVRDKVEEVRRTLGGHGGLLLAPSHILEPEVPWENVLAFCDAAKNPVKKTESDREGL